jgi:outer membrane lipoprotein-sorting protein
MKRIALSLATAVALAAPAAADPVPLREINAYLNSFATAESSFTQINADGTVSTGSLYLERPGRARFEYDDEELLVMAGGGRLAIFDGRSNSSADQYPLADTPLSIILERRVDLASSGMVVGQDYDGTSTRIVVQDPERPEIGTLELVFTDDPVELRQWVVTDQSGQQTTIALGALRTGVDVPAILFSIPQELDRRRGN